MYRHIISPYFKFLALVVLEFLYGQEKFIIETKETKKLYVRFPEEHNIGLSPVLFCAYFSLHSFIGSLYSFKINRCNAKVKKV